MIKATSYVFYNLVSVIMNVAIDMRVPTDDIPSDSAGGIFHD